MKYLIFISVIFIFSCTSKKEVPDGKDPNADWLTLYNADSARIDFKNGNRRILCYGLREMMISQEQSDSLCKVFNFYEFEAAGCEVTDEFIKGVDEYNQEMEFLLKKLNGKNWREKYLNIMDSLHKIQRLRDEIENKNDDSIQMIQSNKRKEVDGIEMAQEVQNKIDYRKRMDAYKKELEKRKSYVV